ncbi:MAG TPA: hypothetical protein VH083_11020 [Myxococcales bacterium]|nr:hypothetical protein [Myxococcales bacterium]
MEQADAPRDARRVTKVLPGPPLETTSSQVLRALVSETDCLEVGALVLAARDARR